MQLKSQGALSPEGFVAACLDAVGPLEVSESTYAELLVQARDGGDVRWDTEADSTASEKRIGIMLALIAASRDYQFA